MYVRYVSQKATSSWIPRPHVQTINKSTGATAPKRKFRLGWVVRVRGREFTVMFLLMYNIGSLALKTPIPISMPTKETLGLRVQTHACFACFVGSVACTACVTLGSRGALAEMRSRRLTAVVAQSHTPIYGGSGLGI